MGKVWSKWNSNKHKSRSEQYETQAKATEEPKNEQEILLEEIVADNGNNGEALNELGIIEFEKNNKNSVGLALKYLLRADKLGKTDFLSSYYLGVIYMDHLNKPDKSVHYFLKSIQK